MPTPLTSTFHSQSPAALLHPHKRKADKPNKAHDRRPRLRPRELAAVSRLYGPANRGPGQRRKRRNAESHPQSRAHRVEPFGDAGDAGGGETLEAAGAYAVETREDVQARDVVDGEPAERDDGPGEGYREHHVDGPDAVRDDWGDDAEDDPGAVDEDHHD